MRDLDLQLQTATELCELAQEVSGEESRWHAEALYLKAKAQFTTPGSPPSLALAVIKRAIKIWKGIPVTNGPSDLNHVMSLLLKATILSKGMNKFREAVKVNKKAA